MVPASVIAKELKLPLGFLVVKKIGAPGNPELAIGAVAGSEQYLDSEMVASTKTSKAFLAGESRRKNEEKEERMSEYLKHYKNPSLKGKKVILVDDGVATGTSITAAIKAAKAEGAKKVFVAVPFTSEEGKDKIRKEGAELITIKVDPNLSSVGEYYESFPQVEDEEVLSILENAKNSYYNK